MPEETASQPAKKLTRAEKRARFPEFLASLPPVTRTPEETEALAMQDPGFQKYREKLQAIGYEPLDKTAKPAL